MKSVRFEHDWFSAPLPANVRLGARTWLYSSYAFSHYASQAPIGLQVGSDTGLYHGTFFDLGPDAAVEIGDYCSIVGAIFSTNGRVRIGSYTFIAHEVVLGDGDWVKPSWDARGTFAPAGKENSHLIDIGANVWIGTQASVIGNVTIGEGAIIGAGAVVTQDVPPYSLCVGNPMRIVRSISSDSQAQRKPDQNVGR
jgi:acetyltransferase-like isoleucine patch superfamily enzyme